VMITGRNFTYAHLPKVGGDAAVVYFLALTKCSADPFYKASKHDPYWERIESYAKEHLVCGIRRLPDWTWSFMYELTHHMRRVGPVLGLDNPVNVEFALSLPWADHSMLRVIHLKRVTDWIRCENVFDDIVEFIDKQVEPLDSALISTARKLPTKPRRNKGHPFSADQVAQLYKLNPHWAAVEKEIYGGWDA